MIASDKFPRPLAKPAVSLFINPNNMGSPKASGFIGADDVNVNSSSDFTVFVKTTPTSVRTIEDGQPFIHSSTLSTL